MNNERVPYQASSCTQRPHFFQKYQKQCLKTVNVTLYVSRISFILLIVYYCYFWDFADLQIRYRKQLTLLGSIPRVSIVRMMPAVNFINILCTAFTLIDLKSVKKDTDDLTAFFTLLGSTSAKAVRRTLIKLSPRYYGRFKWCSILAERERFYFLFRFNLL
jgi:hypothetical protein